jgi:hypothetical protein
MALAVEPFFVLFKDIKIQIGALKNTIIACQQIDIS